MCALQQAALDCCRPSLLYSPTGGLAPLWVARGGPPSTIPRHCTESFSVLYAVIQSLSIYVWLHALGCCAGTHGARMVHVLLAVSCVSVEPACIWTSRMKTSPVQVSFLAAAYVRGPAENVLYCNVAVPKAVCEWFLAEEYPRYGRCGTARQRGIRGRRAVPQPEAPFPWASGTRRWCAGSCLAPEAAVAAV